MPMDVFADTPLVNITGAVSVTKDVQSGVAGNMTVAGTQTVSGASNFSGLVTANSGLSVGGSLTGVSLTAVSQLTASTGISITAGGLTITAGGESVTAGGITVTAGGISVTAGGVTVTGGATLDQLGGGMSPTAVAIAAAGTVATNVRHSRVSPTAAATSCVLGTGTFNGQTVIVDNRNTTAANAVSFALTSTASNILNAASTIIISGMTTKQFVWDGSFWNT